MAEYDDRDERDEEYDDRDDRRGRRRDRDRGEGRPEVGREKVRTPGTFLIVAGLLGVVLSAGSVAFMVAKPTLMYDVLVDLTKKQPAGPEREKALKDLEDQKDGMRMDGPLNIGSTALGALLNLLTLAGGVAMRGAKGYGLAMTGAIAGIVPMSGCCCLTLPVGIWALVVLVGPDAKAAFAARSVYPDDRD